MLYNSSAFKNGASPMVRKRLHLRSLHWVSMLFPRWDFWPLLRPLTHLSPLLLRPTFLFYGSNRISITQSSSQISSFPLPSLPMVWGGPMISSRLWFKKITFSSISWPTVLDWQEQLVATHRRRLSPLCQQSILFLFHIQRLFYPPYSVRQFGSMVTPISLGPQYKSPPTSVGVH